METMIVRKEAVGPWPMNSYALICPTTKKSVLIDPGAEPEKLVAMLGDSEPIAILLTHTHPDHIGALDAVADRLDLPLMAHELAGADHPGGQAHLDLARSLLHGDTIEVGEHTLLVHHTPGHIADQICFDVQGGETIIVGDTIFVGGPGKTWSPEQFQTTLRTLKQEVLKWPDYAMCYPGHGPQFRLGDIRPAIEQFVERDHGSFYGDATWDM